MSRAIPLSYDAPLEDIALRVTEWPGSTDPVLLVHATGFHGRCWDQIAARLPDVHLYAVDLRFHGASERHGEVDWALMTRDIEQLVDTLDLFRVIGVGHSIGGHLIARAAAARMPRFEQLLLIDPVVMPREVYTERFGQTASIDPGETPVSRRKNVWQSAEQMYQRFRERPPFDRWQDQVLRDYCAYALREAPGESAYQLACDPLHESAIYLSQRGNEVIYDLLPRLALPVTLLRARPGTKPFDFSASPTWPGLVDELPNAREFYLPEMSHFIPMEDPDLVAQMISDMLAGTGVMAG